MFSYLCCACIWLSQDEDYSPLRVMRSDDGAPAHYAENAKGFSIGILPQTWMDPEQVLC